MGPAEDTPATNDGDLNPSPDQLEQLSQKAAQIKRELDQPTFAFKRAARGADRTFVDTTYPCKHESRTFPVATSDGEFIFKIPTACPKCTDKFYWLRSDGDVLNPMESVPQL